MARCGFRRGGPATDALANADLGDACGAMRAVRPQSGQPAPSLVPRFGDENENQQQGELASGEPPSHANAPPKNKVSQTISRLLANSNFNVGKRRGQGYESGSPVEWEAVPTFGLVGKLRSIV